MLLDINGDGEREYIASAYTTLVYEQEFGADIIDEFISRYAPTGRRKGGVKVNSTFILRVLWAMARTADKVYEASHGNATAPDAVPASFEAWLLSAGSVNISDLIAVVADEVQRGLLRAGDADAGTDAGTDEGQRDED